jgi:glycosyltransferase involved in cell wall biosynthesis|tara:strand:+ start:585 stop:1760 length:1176 start_codon:yes stop_codon:yes gene_type:complete
LTNKNDFVISSHVWTTGPPDDLAEYLVQRAREVLFIGHPLFPSETRQTYVKTFSNKTLKTQSIFRPKLPNVAAYLVDFVLSLVIVLIKKKKYNIYFGVDPLNALAGLFLKKLGIIRFVIFYTIDYVPNRFESRILNRIYHLIDFICVSNCDATWNLSEKMLDQRKRVYGDSLIGEKQFTVPLGINFYRIQQNLGNIRKKSKLIYVGRLEKTFGVELVVQSFAKLVEDLPYLELIITGSGEEEKELRKMVHNYSLDSKVKFLGVIPDHKELELLLSECIIGFALYAPTKETYKQYTDVGKPKLYMACGLPVIITRIPPIAREIKRVEAGIVVDHDINSVVSAAKTILLNDKLYERYKENAILYANQFDWEYIFDKAFRNFKDIVFEKRILAQ